MELKIHKGLTGLSELENDWNILFNSIKEPTYTQSIIWHKAYLTYLVKNDLQSYFFCIYQDSQIIAILPFEIQLRKFYLLNFNTIGFSEHNHFGINDILTDSNKTVQLLFDFIYSELKKNRLIQWDLFYFKRVMASSNASKCILQDSYKTIESKTDDCFIIPIENFEDRSNLLSKRFKYDLRYSKKKMEGLGSIQIKSSRNLKDLENAFKDFLFVEGSGWKGKEGSGSAIKLNKELTLFYYEILKGFGKKGELEINIMYLDNNPIACQYNIVLNSSVFILKVGYIEDFKKVSLGHLLIKEKYLEYLQINPYLKFINCNSASWFSPWRPKVMSCKDIYNCRNIFVAAYIKLILWVVNYIKILKLKQ